MKIPVSYSYRSLLARKLTTLFTVMGIALVVFVFAAVLMMAEGLRQTLVSTGHEGNYVILRKSAASEIMSAVDRDSARLISTMPEVASAPDGKPFLSNEMVTIINLHKYDTNDMGNVIVRGVSEESIALRPQIQLIEGQMFRTGTSEVIVGRSIAERFQGCRVGQVLKFGSRDWRIVGVFEADKGGFESEIWGDVEQILAAFNRTVYSTVTLRSVNSSSVPALKARMQSEPQLQTFEIKNEREYFDEQSKALGTFIKWLGLVITIIFSLGAMIGAMITMYASVANRTVEIGTLRSLGFQRRNILAAFLIEALLLSLLGGLIGILMASFLQTITVSTLNFATFSELAFGFYLNPGIVISSLIFAASMGIIGGFLPAVRAARLQIVDALRSV